MNPKIKLIFKITISIFFVLTITIIVIGIIGGYFNLKDSLYVTPEVYLAQFIDEKGNVVIKASENLDSYQNYFINGRLYSKNGVFYIDKKGYHFENKNNTEKSHLSKRSIKYNLTPVNKKGKWGYADEKGRIIIKPQFYKAYNFSEGLAKVYISAKKTSFVFDKYLYCIYEHKTEDNKDRILHVFYEKGLKRHKDVYVDVELTQEYFPLISKSQNSDAITPEIVEWKLLLH